MGPWIVGEWNADRPGVPRSERAHIFEDFAQLETGRDGVGAGLAAVGRLVVAHGGRIWVGEGRRLGGALFRVLVPAVAAEQRAAG